MKTNRFGVTLIALLLAVLVAGCSNKKDVPTVEVREDRIVESFSEQARTRLEKEFQVSMPVTADVARIALQPGDRVKKGESLVSVDLLPLRAEADEARAVVGQLEAQHSLIMDASVEDREVEHARAMADAAGAEWRAASFRVEGAQLRLDRARKELERLQTLQKEGSSSQSDLDDAELEANTARAHFNAATAEHKRLTAMKTSAVAQVAMIQSRIDRKGLEAANVLRQLDQAQARAQRAKHDLDLAAVASPIDGVVLERHQLGGGPIPAGTPLFLLGELNELEVEADVLTQDAFQLSPGAPVEYVVASGLPPLQGKVVRIEPAGFTKISSLGVEQQRVVVISSLDSRPENLGLGFRLIARYKKSSLDKALLVPRSSVLQDPNGTRYVFRDTEGVARRVDVELGLRSDFEVQIVKGLSAGDRVVQTPDATVTDGSSL